MTIATELLILGVSTAIKFFGLETWRRLSTLACMEESC
jgi:hypothetical protein